jgi:carboxypeptidase PM20D1
MKKIGLGLFVGLLLLIAVLLFNVVNFKSKQLGDTKPPNDYPVVDARVDHLAKAIRFPSVSYDDGHRDTAAFEGFLMYIDTAFPLVKQRLDKTDINGFTRIYHWVGKSKAQKPVTVYAHYDVVPIETVNRAEWKQEPFSGVVKEDYLWGRGAIDDKSSVMAILESVEALLAKGFQPERDVFIVFGHDEETGGMDGAKYAAEYLAKRGIQTAFHLDEGGLVAHGIVPDMTKPVALIGTAEKGYMTLELTVNMKGGHSSKPAKETAIQLLSKAIHSLQEHPFPKQSPQAVKDFIEYVGPEMPQPLKTVFANSWLFNPIILSVYEKSAEGNAMIRTTGVPTIVEAGIKENLIPGQAKATANFRLLTGQTSAEVIGKVKDIIGDERVLIKQLANTFEPSPTTATGSEAFRLVQKACAEVYPDAVVSPFLDIGSTDSKHFEPLGGDVIRFLPVRMDNDLLGTFHGVNERIRVKDYMEAIAFYEFILKHL